MLKWQASSQKGTTSRQGCRAGPPCAGRAARRGPGLAEGGCHLCPTVGTAGLAHPVYHRRRSASASVGIRDAAEQIPISSNTCLMLARSQICMKAKLVFFQQGRQDALI